MTGMIGMDVNEVRQLAMQLHAKADEIENIAGQLTSRLAGTDWRGSDATRFRSEWDHNYRSQLGQVAAALRTAGDQAKRDAMQQEQASA
jgi:uncharacterized protein YukE